MHGFPKQTLGSTEILASSSSRVTTSLLRWTPLQPDHTPIAIIAQPSDASTPGRAMVMSRLTLYGFSFQAFGHTIASFEGVAIVRAGWMKALVGLFLAACARAVRRRRSARPSTRLPSSVDVRLPRIASARRLEATLGIGRPSRGRPAAREQDDSR